MKVDPALLFEEHLGALFADRQTERIATAFEDVVAYLYDFEGLISDLVGEHDSAPPFSVEYLDRQMHDAGYKLWRLKVERLFQNREEVIRKQAFRYRLIGHWRHQSRTFHLLGIIRRDNDTYSPHEPDMVAITDQYDGLRLARHPAKK